MEIMFLGGELCAQSFANILSNVKSSKVPWGAIIYPHFAFAKSKIQTS